MPRIQYSSNNVVVKIQPKLATADFYVKTILASNLTDAEKETLLKEAGLLDSVKGLFGGGPPIPEADFKALWAKESPAGQFSPRMIAWKRAASGGKWRPQDVLSLLTTMSSFSSTAKDLLAKNKPLLDAVIRGNNTPATQKGWTDLMSSINPSLSLIQKTTPGYYTGAGFDRQQSQYV